MITPRNLRLTAFPCRGILFAVLAGTTLAGFAGVVKVHDAMPTQLAGDYRHWEILPRASIIAPYGVVITFTVL